MTNETYEERQKRERQAELAANYRAIGPAAILAALACQARALKESAAGTQAA